eukprot:GFUD01042141.1.p1 GENE.GFUD01042141.1~~GFUD01042141.1.p1  ORF type:complete len:443 (+),score=104.77 GFUD01042141.1:137-1465(+)
MLIMTTLGFEYTSNLVDLLFAPHGSEPLHRSLVPQQPQNKTLQERLKELENFCVSHGLNQDSLTILNEAGFKSVSLLSLLLSSNISRLFPTISSQQKRFLEICISRLDPRPPYQMTVGLRRLLSSPLRNFLTTFHEEPNKKKENRNPNPNPEQNTELSDELRSALKLVESSRKILECPVCYLACPPPRIWQCNNGHLTCAPCHSHTRVCPLCRTQFSTVRPLAAERLASQLPTPCKNQQHGCTTSLPWAERLEHEAVCDHAVGHCPVLSCTAMVPVNSIVEHLTSTHKWSEDFIHHKLDKENTSFSSSISTTTYLHSLQDQQNWWWGPQCISFDNELFFLLISRRVEHLGERGYFNFWVWVAGNKAGASKYRYSITVGGPSSLKGEEMKYSSEPVPLEVGLEAVRDEQTSLLLSDGAIRRMIRNGERLYYNISIEQVQEEKD